MTKMTKYEPEVFGALARVQRAAYEYFTNPGLCAADFLAARKQALLAGATDQDVQKFLNNGANNYWQGMLNDKDKV